MTVIELTTRSNLLIREKTGAILRTLSENQSMFSTEPSVLCFALPYLSAYISTVLTHQFYTVAINISLVITFQFRIKSIEDKEYLILSWGEQHSLRPAGSSQNGHGFGTATYPSFWRAFINVIVNSSRVTGSSNSSKRSCDNVAYWTASLSTPNVDTEFWYDNHVCLCGYACSCQNLSFCKWKNGNAKLAICPVWIYYTRTGIITPAQPGKNTRISGVFQSFKKQKCPLSIPGIKVFDCRLGCWNVFGGGSFIFFGKSRITDKEQGGHDTEKNFLFKHFIFLYIMLKNCKLM